MPLNKKNCNNNNRYPPWRMTVSVNYRSLTRNTDKKTEYPFPSTSDTRDLSAAFSSFFDSQSPLLRGWRPLLPRLITHKPVAFARCCYCGCSLSRQSFQWTHQYTLITQFNERRQTPLNGSKFRPKRWTVQRSFICSAAVWESNPESACLQILTKNRRPIDARSS